MFIFRRTKNKIFIFYTNLKQNKSKNLCETIEKIFNIFICISFSLSKHFLSGFTGCAVGCLIFFQD